ncbi:Periphilin-1 [Manis pentadactyla]|nr:Periphilin-1 [Manis pentadactyla]
MTKRSRDEDFLQEFQDLNVRAQIHTRGTRQASVPTWGQLKKLIQEGEHIVRQAGQTLTPSSLFLAMMAIVTCQSTAGGTEENKP